MNIDFYWVLFFLALFVFAAIGFGLSALVPGGRVNHQSSIKHRGRHS
ncbi:hypothetical protein [Paraburkholderia sp. GAS334]|jgi:hypothetical protein